MSLSSPAQVIARLDDIDVQLAELLNEFEDAGREWFLIRPDREQAELVAYAESSGTTVERKLAADAAGAAVGADEEMRWEVLRAKRGVLEARANIGMAILKAQGRS